MLVEAVGDDEAGGGLLIPILPRSRLYVKLRGGGEEEEEGSTWQITCTSLSFFPLLSCRLNSICCQVLSSSFLFDCRAESGTRTVYGAGRWKEE